ncbi:MAG TPA: CdaR family protein [Thermoanaerobaculia bacterium]|nr:CdaR family protein [Thermoanaerobaculia bacterium]
MPHKLWPLRLLSVVMAVVLWLLFSYSGREGASSERALSSVPVTYNTPQGYVLLDPTSTLEVRVSGGEQTILDLNPFQVSAVISLEPRAGIQEIVLETRHISRPPGIDVVSISPDRLSLRVDREIQKRLRVVPDGRGEPAAGAVEGEHGVVPEFVTVKGPQSLLESRDTILAPVSIAGRARSFEQSVTLEPPHPLIQVLGSSTVRVSVLLEPPSLSSAIVPAGSAAETNESIPGN